MSGSGGRGSRPISPNPFVAGSSGYPIGLMPESNMIGLAGLDFDFGACGAAAVYPMPPPQLVLEAASPVLEQQQVSKKPAAYSMDRAVFLLLRVKKVFRRRKERKKQQQEKLMRY